MLRILINFFGSAHLREIRFNRDSCDKVTIEDLKKYLPDQRCELILLKVNNTYPNIIMQDKRTIGFYMNNCGTRKNPISASIDTDQNDVEVVHILSCLNSNQSSSLNGQNKLQDLLKSKNIQLFIEQFKIRSDKNLMRESMRLKDIRMMKLSQKEEENYLQYLQVERPSKKYPTILSNIIFNSPREDPLPYYFYVY
ncbi:hypothetical protein M9Y10_020323 [Tritrichomonas musculus]|uniref:Uncharacterized protein n=1 Tax=Tritrichomonas musculus TaxID=1915356 RepID=A0ABR2HGX3_9EUKA